MQQAGLYQAILARRSVRRYDRARLEEATIARVREIAATVQPLVAGNRYDVLLGDVSAGRDLVTALGAYGRFVNPPHYLLPYALGEQHLLEDLGFRAEQVAVRMTMLGLGSCFIGCLGREAALRASFALPEGARVGALLIYGRPASALGARGINALLRAVLGATSKLPAERLFFRDTFATPAAPPRELAALIEAGRRAPSAVDAQPWRFLWRGGQLYLFVKRHNPRYGGGARQQCNLYDGGICMGNIALALQALGMDGQWLLCESQEPGIPEHPAELLPLARLTLRGDQPGTQAGITQV